MRNENQEVFPQKDPSIFRISPNRTADYLEKVLGIRFSCKPTVVELNFANRYRWARREKSFMPFLIARGIELGFYDWKYHTLFMQPYTGDPKLLFAGVHENMHAYAALKSDRFREPDKDFMNALNSQQNKGSIATLGAMEKLIAVRCIGEGLSHWSALRVANSLPNLFTPLDIQRFEHSVLYDYHAGEEGSRYMARQQANLQTNFTVLCDSLFEGPKKNPRAFYNSLGKIGHQAYVIGYYFIEMVLREFGNRGIEMIKSIDWIIANPPDNIADVVNPEYYARRQKIKDN